MTIPSGNGVSVGGMTTPGMTAWISRTRVESVGVDVAVNAAVFVGGSVGGAVAVSVGVTVAVGVAVMVCDGVSDGSTIKVGSGSASRPDASMTK